jgi:hypothetical protein
MELNYEILDYGEQGQDMLIYATDGPLPGGLKKILIELENDTQEHLDWVTMTVGASLFMSEWFSDKVYTKGRLDIYD